ncbi:MULTISPECIES: hypothetical protein [Vibrio]|uniref:hypothetical protein n=1 Tax=Vibrio TaxID=662 RepID=UPI001BD6A433|nr:MULTISPECIES: hypothetical protein [Vibrio]MBT0118283.1 hypothetical protein [Vibrio alginolyticus]MCG9235859.1 hypothetical protein [Vibrio harveyi]MCG9586082.1 hypothetical protein [Vibrio harveyi]NRB69759.1 hypothetical protein [Vibrio sp.]
MKDNYRYLQEFIQDQRSFFEDALLPEVNDGVEQEQSILSWSSTKWVYGGHSKGFLAKGKNTVTFHEVKCGGKGRNLLKEDEPQVDFIEINPIYQNFMKAYATSLNRNQLVSTAVTYEQVILLKRVYIRMYMAGVDCHPCNINSEFLQDATDMLAASRTGSSAKTNASKDYDTANVIAKNLNFYAFTLTQIDVQRKEKSNIGTNYTENAKKKNAKDKGDSSLNEKNLSIQTFLNVVALRGMVQTDGEKITLNLVLLLMVTGFRHMEAALIGYKDFKIVEIENKTTRDLMNKRGLPTFYVGIKYQGEKGAGKRTHWIEPLAVELVEDIWVETILLTEKLRRQLEHLRDTNFKSLLPKEWQSAHVDGSVISITRDKTVDLETVVHDVYESYSSTVLKRGFGAAKDYAKKKLSNSKLKIKPISGVGDLYLISDIERFLESEQTASSDLVYRITDSRTGSTYGIQYEGLLFIIPKGSGAVTRAGAIKVLPEIIDKTIISKFLGYGTKDNNKRSIFAKYNLTEEDGEFTFMYSHVPRHGINTFFSLAGVSEHLQAMFMGRKDLTQNKKYQHLTNEDRIIQSQLVTVGNAENANNENTALETVKSQAEIALNPNLTLDNSIAQSIHSHTTQKDKTSFIVDIVENSNSNVFSEWDDELELLDDDEKSETIQPHSDLAIMDIGSCMRKLKAFQCPYNMKCQDGSPCPYFTLTGRMDETTKIEALLERIQSEIVLIKQLHADDELTHEECQEIIEELNVRTENISFHLQQSEVLDSEKVMIDLTVLDKSQKPKMLSSLFGLEQKELDKMKAQQK